MGSPPFPASGAATGSFNGLNPKSKFLAVKLKKCALVLAAVITLFSHSRQAKP
jgi:hypothetical protein